jgi:hypothetical protein
MSNYSSVSYSAWAAVAVAGDGVVDGVGGESVGSGVPTTGGAAVAVGAICVGSAATGVAGGLPRPTQPARQSAARAISIAPIHIGVHLTAYIGDKA